MSIERAQPKYFIVGEILRPHGVRGEVRMRVLTDNRDHLHQLESVYLAESPEDPALVRRDLLSLRFNKAYALLALENCRSRNDAELLRGKKVLIGLDQAAPLNDGEYYLFELIGLRVVADENEIGRVKEIIETGANDVYVVQSDAYGEVLIPAHEKTILEINFEAKTITMTLPEGLLPTGSAPA